MSKPKGISPNRESLHSLLNGTNDSLEINQIIHEYGVGVDCHSKFYYCAVWMIVEGEVKKFDFEFGVSRKEIEEAKEIVLDTLENVGIDVDPTKFRYVCESSATYHKPLMLGWQGTPSVINPSLAANTVRKTDKIDANMMAFQSLTGIWKDSYIYPEEHQEVRDYYRTSIMYQREMRRVGSRLLSIQTTYGITISSQGSIKVPKIRSAVEDLCNNRKYIDEHLVPISPVVKELILHYYSELDELKKKYNDYLKKALTMAMNRHYFTEDRKIDGRELYEILTSIPGIGKKSALVIMIETSSVLRFKNSKAYVAYCGFDPSMKVSAGKVTEFKRRNGNQYIHSVLTRAATPVINRHQEPFGQWAYILSKKSKRGGHRKAQSALARRICKAVYHCWKKGERFSYESYELANYQVRKVDIEDSSMSTRVKNLLVKHGIRTSIKCKEREDFVYTIPGCGPKAREEISQWLSSLKAPSNQEQKKKPTMVT